MPKISRVASILCLIAGYGVHYSKSESDIIENGVRWDFETDSNTSLEIIQFPGHGLRNYIRSPHVAIVLQPPFPLQYVMCRVGRQTTSLHWKQCCKEAGFANALCDIWCESELNTNDDRGICKLRQLVFHHCMQNFTKTLEALSWSEWKNLYTEKFSIDLTGSKDDIQVSNKSFTNMNPALGPHLFTLQCGINSQSVNISKSWLYLPDENLSTWDFAMPSDSAENDCASKSNIAVMSFLVCGMMLLIGLCVFGYVCRETLSAGLNPVAVRLRRLEGRPIQASLKPNVTNYNNSSIDFGEKQEGEEDISEGEDISDSLEDGYLNVATATTQGNGGFKLAKTRVPIQQGIASFNLAQRKNSD